MRLRHIATCLFAGVLVVACTPDTAAPGGDTTNVTLVPRSADSPTQAPPAPTGDSAFDATYAQARINEKQSGYDEPLSRALATDGLTDALSACMDGHAQRHDVRGYLDFPAQGAYRFVVQPPATPFSTCVARAMEGHPVPEPPSRPYVHAMGFFPDGQPPTTP